MNQRNLAGYSPQGRRELDMTEVTEHAHTHISIYGLPGGVVVKNPPIKCRRNKRHGFNPWVGKIP